MPPAVAAAGIAAAGSLGGALIGRSGQGRAIGAQERATNAQIALERERDAARTGRYNQAMEAYKAEKAQYDATRRALLEHYGVKMAAPAPGPVPGEARAMGGMSLGQLMGASAGASRLPLEAGGAPGAPAVPTGPAGPQGPEAPGQASPEEDQFDWRRYGVR